MLPKFPIDFAFGDQEPLLSKVSELSEVRCMNAGLQGCMSENYK